MANFLLGRRAIDAPRLLEGRDSRQLLHAFLPRAFESSVCQPFTRLFVCGRSLTVRFFSLGEDVVGLHTSRSQWDYSGGAFLVGRHRMITDTVYCKSICGPTHESTLIAWSVTIRVEDGNDRQSCRENFQLTDISPASSLSFSHI